MVNNFFERFTEWQNYVHYLFLAIWVYIWHTLPLNEVIEQIYVNNNALGLPVLILWWTIGLLIGDTIVHGVFWFLPKPLQWRD